MSPSSAFNENAAASEITSRRHDVATTLRLGGHVTGRSIAYVATQVCQALLNYLRFVFSYFIPKLVFSLSSARDWKKQHAGFHFPTFYNFIVDMFEDPEDKIAKRSINELVQWWNRYVSVQYMMSDILMLEYSLLLVTSFHQLLLASVVLWVHAM